MIAEVISIGDELTSGQRLDTNSQWLSQELGDLGVRTMFHSTVGDDLEANRRVFREAAQRVDIVLCTGGLGPTADDLTRQAMAEAFDRPLELDQPSLAYICEMFASRGREMPERNRVQAMFPKGSLVVPNPNGTAPGIDLTVSDRRRCRIFCLPGVPAEMKDMWQETVKTRLSEHLGDALNSVRHFRLKCFGIGESSLEAMLPDLIRRGRNPTVGITVSKATITLRVTGQAETEEVFQELIAPTVVTIRQELGNIVFGEEDDELQHAVGRLLQTRKQTVAVVEWGTGGLIGDWLTSVTSAHEFFVGSTTIASRVAASQLLQVSHQHSPAEHAKQLAIRAREAFGADFGLAMGEFPGDTQDINAKVFVGLATPQSSQVAGRRFAGHPDILKERAAKQALDVLRLHLLGS